MKAFSGQARALIILLLLIPAGWSCQEEKRTFMNAPAGSANEVIVVMPKYRWDGRVGEALRENMGYDIRTFSQSEPVLTLVNIPEDAFNGVFRSHRNLIFCEVSSQITKPGIQMQRDKWASTQLILTLQAPNDSALVQLIRNNGENLVNRILMIERERATGILRQDHEKTIYESLLKNHSLMLDVPKGFTIQKDSGGFVWLEQPKGDNMLGIFIWFYAYKDTAQFSAKSLLAKRNEYLKNFVPGGPEGSYMTTEEEMVPEFKQTYIGENYFAELAGLWTLEKGFMGGPFVNVSTVDTKRNRIVTVEGWVYAPNQNKRNWYRQLQSVAYTIRFPQ
jgi:hypothetical protein